MAVNISGLEKSQNFLKSHIPYVELLDIPQDEKRSIIQNDNGRIFSVFKIYIEDDKMDEDILTQRSEALSQLLSSGFDHSFEFTFDYIRSIKHYDVPLLLSEDKHENTNEMLKKRAYNFSKEPFFENNIYFSICYTPTSTLKNKKIILTDRHVEEFLNKRTVLETYMKNAGYVPTLLCKDELITYLYQSICNDFEIKNPQTMLSEPAVALDEYFSKIVSIVPNSYPVMINDKLTLCCSFHTLPRFTYPDMMSKLTEIDSPIRFFIKYNCRDISEAESPIYKQRDKEKSNMFRLKASLHKAENIDQDEVNLSSLRGKEECDSAIRHLQSENIAAGYVTLTIMLSSTAEEEDRLEDIKNVLESKLSLMGIPGDYNELLNTQRFLNVLIGSGLGEKPDSFYALADNVADFLMVSSTIFHYKSEHLEKITGSNVPFLMGKSGQRGLYKFSPSGNTGNFGHTFMIGKTGGGKSVTLNLFANEWLKFKNTKVVYIDMGLSMLHSVQANNGAVFYPGGDKTSFCPFHFAKDHKAQVLSFLESIALANNFKLTSKERLAIEAIIDHNLPYGEEDLETFYILYKGKVKDSPLSDALLQYIDVYGYLFNGKNDAFYDLPRICGIELGKLFEGDIKTLIYPALVYIFNSLERIFIPQEPTLLILDEAWRYLKDDFFASYITKWLKQLRKNNAMVIIATQDLTDILESKMAETIINNCYTRIFLRNPDATQSTIFEKYQRIGVPKNIIEKISTLTSYHQIVNQEGTFREVNWMIRDDLQNIVTSDKEKNIFIKHFED